jgi:GNAT superfamily N-acetyltransferase
VREAALRTIRQANEEDIAPVARLFRAVCTVCLPYLPDLHTPEEDLAFFQDRVFAECDVWIHGAMDGFIAFRAGWVDHLYVRPEQQRHGVGAALLAQAMTAHSPLRLWTFQKNTTALAFYRAQGFREVERTDGSGNEEREPDVLLEWSRDRA